MPGHRSRGTLKDGRRRLEHLSSEGRHLTQCQAPQESQAVLEASFQAAMGFLALGHEHNS